MNIANSKKRMYVLLAALSIVLAIGLYVALSQKAQEPIVKFVTSSEAWEKINGHQDVFLLDVRSYEEFYNMRIPGAVNIPHDMIKEKRHLLPQDTRTYILLYCRTWMRALDAVNELLDLGYTNIIAFPGMAFWEYDTISG